MVGNNVELHTKIFFGLAEGLVLCLGAEELLLGFDSVIRMVDNTVVIPWL